MPQLGIALAAYQPNPEVFAEQLASIQKQTEADWICVITFDTPQASTTEHPKIRPFLTDPRFVWMENPHRLGHKKNFERAIQECLKHAVRWIACSDQDDIWYPNKLETCLNEIQKRPPLSVVHSDMHILKGTEIESKTAWTVEKRGIAHTQPSHFFVRNVVAGCSMLFDAELARLYPQIPAGAEFHDWWYALAASYHGGVYGIPLPLYAYRQHSNNEVGVTPFRSIFFMPSHLSLIDLFKKCWNGYTRSKALASHAQAEGMPLSWSQKLTFIWPWDFGLGLLLLGLTHWRADPPFTRACLARGIGKCLGVLIR